MGSIFSHTGFNLMNYEAKSQEVRRKHFINVKIGLKHFLYLKQQIYKSLDKIKNLLIACYNRLLNIYK